MTKLTKVPRQKPRIAQTSQRVRVYPFGVVYEAVTFPNQWVS